MVHKGGARSKELMAAKGVTEALVPAALVPHKPKLLANAKTNNYLLNALMAMAAEDRGGNLGIGVDEDGFISEQAIACVAFLGPDGVLRAPPFERILEGTTLRRADEILEPIPGLFSRLSYEPVDLATVREAVEVISFGGGTVLPIVAIDASALPPGDPGGAGYSSDVIKVGDGTPGPLFKALYSLINADFLGTAGSSEKGTSKRFLDEIPYTAYVQTG
mmetsp:Transcript_65385/g.147509  ORF Transcript_65385/g.147509 Transcript_65385/m.147509 type:complete len:219 (+) Transcript_65385:187-843(+)